ncbi:uncharacterized protein LOC141653815 isoform X2 [Silene latifolia]|uniref:uncharacterized protein LOC141653815 isoform X2 n=1 Tax=Silene latifolia TaxID=37657 RepID=UPI003D771DAA
MQGGRGRGGFFPPDPFAGFGGFGGFGGHHSLMSSVFGGRDPFDDPFFTQPPGSMFESGFFGPRGSPFAGAPFATAPHTGLIGQQEPHPNKRRGPVIEEITSDDEKEENGCPSKSNDYPRKHSRLHNEPYVEIPDDGGNGGRNKHIQHSAEFGNRMSYAQPQSQFYTFQSSSVSYGGGDGAYYTKSMTKRAGSDGVAFEELKEADSSTGRANHRISRGLHNKGHTLSRKLNSDGKVDTSQILHNLGEGELDGFEQAWEGSSGRHLTGSRQRLEGGNFGPGSSGQASRGGWALPSTQHPDYGQNNAHIAGDNNAAYMQQSTGRKAEDRGSRGKRRA